MSAEESRERIKSGISLSPCDIPFRPNRDLNRGGRNYGDDAEFLHRGTAELWYGTIPRVLTPDELIELMSDSRRFSELSGMPWRN